jgi:hypothetical protein
MRKIIGYCLVSADGILLDDPFPFQDSVFLGHGKPLFREGQAAKLKLATTKSFSKLVKVTYEPQY